MNLADISRQLSHGELSQVALGKELLATPSNARITQLVDHVNLALTALYKRFKLKEESLELTLAANTLVYPLASANLLKAEQVLTDLGQVVPLNDGSNPYSCFTPSARKLRVPAALAKQSKDLPEELKTTKLKVVYRANHDMLVAQDAITDGRDLIELELPDAYLQALLYFVASRVHNPVGIVNEFNAGNNWFAKYEGECKRLETEGLDIDSLESNTRLQRGGWV